ncbi:MAG: response regulator [Bacteroidetes bacterium]|nr:response regulator [Bacteroidota bacterium]
MNFVQFLSFFIAGAISFYIYYKTILKPKQSAIQDENIGSAKTEIQLMMPENTSNSDEQTDSISTKSSQQQLQKTLDDLYIVNELGQNITSSLNLQETFRLLYTTLNSMMDAAVVELRVLNTSSNTWKNFTSLQLNEEEKIKDYNNLARWCFANNREIFLADAEHDFARYVFEPLVLPDGRIAKSALVFPIVHDKVVSGTLCIVSFQQNTFNEYHQKIIRLLLGYITVAMQNAITHEELSITKQRAERSEKFMQQFLANMSHEIRTPINAVTGMTHLLLEKGPRNDQLKYLESIQNASESLLVIINDILDLSKIEAGKIEIEHIEFSVYNVVHTIKEIMQFKAEEKGLALHVEIDSNIPAVLIGDPTRLTQIILNLLGNAIKFTEKGSVKLSAKIFHAKTNEVKNVALKQVTLLFSIADTGIGMNALQQKKLFQDYVQASTETSRKYGGTGLGLSISKQLVQLQGGSIEVQSDENKGSVFSFTLPYQISENKQIAVIDQHLSNEMLLKLKGIKILIADDNEYNRIIARETLQLHLQNIEVDEAFDGQMALSMIQKQHYDVVLMDLVMPIMDGYEAMHMIRNELPASKNRIPVIALTASVVKSEIEKSKSAGMNGFIPKPFKSFELMGSVYNALFGLPVHQSSKQSSMKNLKTITDGEFIDFTMLLDYAEGDQVRMQRFIELFLTKTPQRIELLKAALLENDYEQLRIISHSMKPQLKSCGAIQAYDFAETIENLSTEKKNLDELPLLVEQLDVVFEKSAIEIKEYLQH